MKKCGRIEAMLKKGKTPNAGASRSDECLAERVLVGIAQRGRNVDEQLALMVREITSSCCSRVSLMKFTA